jgi:apolipoprotein N-acyltransferase
VTAAPHLLLALLAGLALAVAHPPGDVGLLALAVPALLVAAIDVATARCRRVWPVAALAAAVGFGPMLWWVVQPAGFIGWGLLVAVQAGWWILIAVVVRGLPNTVLRPLLVGVVWVGVDALRGIVPLNGFAWGTLGAATVDLPWLAPLARIAGEKAMTLAVVVLSVAAWETLRGPLQAARGDDGRVRWDRVRDVLPAGRVGAAWLGGTALVVTLATVEPPAPTGELDVLVVQPNDIEGTYPGTGRELDLDIATTALALTEASVAEDGVPDLTVWPESSIDADPDRVPELADVLAAGGRVTEGGLLAGVIEDGEDPATEFRNTVQVVDADGQVTHTYQKRRLVPFGEYVPFRDALDWFEPLAQVPRDGQPGGPPHRLDVGDLDVAVAICFETLFGDLVRDNLLAEDGPGDLVVAATNDASFERGGEAAQHLAQSQLRALETGRWVVHGAISGSSAFVDPDGDVHDRTDLFTATTIRRTITTASGRTPYLVTGDWLGPVSMLGLLALAGIAVHRHRRRPAAPGQGLTRQGLTHQEHA